MHSIYNTLIFGFFQTEMQEKVIKELDKTQLWYHIIKESTWSGSSVDRATAF